MSNVLNDKVIWILNNESDKTRCDIDIDILFLLNYNININNTQIFKQDKTYQYLHTAINKALLAQ